MGPGSCVIVVVFLIGALEAGSSLPRVIPPRISLSLISFQNPFTIFIRNHISSKTLQPMHFPKFGISKKSSTMLSSRPGVTVNPAPHGANIIPSGGHFVSTAKDLLRISCHKEFQKMRNEHLIQSSFDDAKVDVQYLGASNGFVDTAVKAYNQHHHLILRPEDVWFSVLVQLNIYINEHAEELRSMLVAHQGQKKMVLEVNKTIAGNSLMGVDWAKFAYQM